jgi:ATP-dependent Clp protease ATP-binding subunit ClpA
MSTESITQDLTTGVAKASLKWERKIALTALEEAGYDLVTLERGVDRALRDLRPAGPREALIDDDAMAAIHALVAKADQEAIALGHNWIGDEHLLLALLSIDDFARLPWVASLQLKYEPVLHAVRRFFEEPGRWCARH